MRFAWLEEKVESGEIRKEAAERIQQDCSKLLGSIGETEKLASAADTAMNVLQIAATVSAVGMGAAALAGAVSNASYDARVRAETDRARAAVLSDPMIPANEKDKAQARFNEILKYAPSLGPNVAVMKSLVLSKYRTGLTQNDITNLVNIETKFTPHALNYAAASHEASKTACSKEEAVGEYLANAFIGMEKLGFDWGGLLSHTGKAIAGPAALGLGILGASAAVGAINRAALKSKLEESFSQILQNSPDSVIHDNPEAAREAFQTLAHFAPHIAAEPHAAKAFVTKIVGFKQGPQSSDLKDLTEVERNMAQAGQNAFNTLGQAFQTVGITPALAGSYKSYLDSHRVGRP